MKRGRLATLALAAALTASACGGSADTAESTASDDQTADTSVATPLPAVSGTTAVDGALIEFNSLEGQDTVLWFWAPW